MDRESAYEMLTAKAQQAAAAKQAAEQAEADEEARARAEKEAAREARSSSTRSRSRAADPLDSFLRSAGGQLGRELTRTVLGTLLKR